MADKAQPLGGETYFVIEIGLFLKTRRWRQLQPPPSCLTMYPSPLTMYPSPDEKIVIQLLAAWSDWQNTTSPMLRFGKLDILPLKFSLVVENSLYCPIVTDSSTSVEEFYSGLNS